MDEGLLRVILRSSLEEQARRKGKKPAPSLELLGAVWAVLVGEQFAQRSKPLNLQGTRLIVGVSSHAWMQELSYRKKDLLRRINRLAPWPFDDLHFMLDMSASSALTPREERSYSETAQQRTWTSLPPSQPPNLELGAYIDELDADLQAVAKRISTHIAKQSS